MTKRLFRIERKDFADQPYETVDPGCPQHNEMMSAISEIRTMLSERAPSSHLPTEVLDTLRADMVEASKIKAELDTIQKAIERTKREIAALRLPGEGSHDFGRMTDELGAIVEGTESATETILSAVERIDEDSSDLSASVKTKQQRDTVSDIQEQVVRIYEACNFQDLTGQRISKVIRAFGFIETHVQQMMNIWGGIESFRGLEPVITSTKVDAHLLNGPSLETDVGVASQDDIDALFD